MTEAPKSDVIEIGSSSIEDLSHETDSPTKVMMMSVEGMVSIIVYFMLFIGKKAKSTIGKQRVFKPFIIEKHTRVADKGSQTGAWITPVSHQGTQCQPSCTESSTQTVLG